MPPDKWTQYAAPANSQTDKWAQYAQPSAAPMTQPHAQGAPQEPSLLEQLQQQFDEATTAEPYSRDQGLGGNTGAALRNLGGGVLSLASPIVHPLQTFKSAVDLAQVAANPASAAGSPTVQGMVQPFIKQPGESWGGYAGRAGGEATKMVGQTVGTKYGGKLTGNAMNAAAGLGEPYVSPVIPPAESQSLALAKAIQPPVVRTFRANVQPELPAIRSFAEANGNPLKSQPEFAQAAQGAAAQHWQSAYDPLVDPIRNNRVTIGGEPGMKDVFGRSHQSATIGDIENRLAEINRLTGPAWKMKDPTLSASALERAAQLQAEAHQLRQTLYEEVGRANNISPELVRDIRERGGRLGSIAEDTQQAIEDRAKSVGRTEEGQPFALPVSSGGVLGTIKDIGTKLRGGRENVADAAFRNALNPPTPWIRNTIRAAAIPPTAAGNLPLQYAALMGRLAATMPPGTARAQPDALRRGLY